MCQGRWRLCGHFLRLFGYDFKDGFSISQYMVMVIDNRVKSIVNYVREVFEFTSRTNHNKLTATSDLNKRSIISLSILIQISSSFCFERSPWSELSTFNKSTWFDINVWTWFNITGNRIRPTICSKQSKFHSIAKCFENLNSLSLQLLDVQSQRVEKQISKHNWSENKHQQWAKWAPAPVFRNRLLCTKSLIQCIFRNVSRSFGTLLMNSISQTTGIN